MHKNEIEMKDKDDTLCDVLASAAFDKYPSDFESKYFQKNRIILYNFFKCITLLLHRCD